MSVMCSYFRSINKECLSTLQIFFIDRLTANSAGDFGGIFTDIPPPSLRPCSPDLNHVDYSIWGAAVDISSEDSKNIYHLNSCWNMISQELIDGAIEQRSKRLSSVVRSRGGHTEHRFS